MPWQVVSGEWGVGRKKLHCKRGENAIFGVWDHPAAIAAPLQRRGIIPYSPPLEGQGWFWRGRAGLTHQLGEVPLI